MFGRLRSVPFAFKISVCPNQGHSPRNRWNPIFRPSLKWFTQKCSIWEQTSLTNNNLTNIQSLSNPIHGKQKHSSPKRCAHEPSFFGLGTETLQKLGTVITVKTIFGSQTNWKHPVEKTNRWHTIGAMRVEQFLSGFPNFQTLFFKWKSKVLSFFFKLQFWNHWIRPKIILTLPMRRFRSLFVLIKFSGVLWFNSTGFVHEKGSPFVKTKSEQHKVLRRSPCWGLSSWNKFSLLFSLIKLFSWKRPKFELKKESRQDKKLVFDYWEARSAGWRMKRKVHPMPSPNSF